MSLKHSRNVLFAVTLLFFMAFSAFAACDKPATTTKNSIVYDDVPRFFTGQGWVMGKKVKNLNEGAQIWICAERSVGFVLGKQSWLQISEARDKPPIGWMLSADTHKAGSRNHPPLALVPKALAQTPQEAVPAPVPGNPIAALSFLAMVLGMMAKELFDRTMGARLRMKTFFRRLLPALVISPVVFSAMLQANIPVPDSKSLAALLAWAFQNGFFWQTLVKTVPAQKEGRASPGHSAKEVTVKTSRAA